MAITSTSKMSPPTPVSCEVPGCEYKTRPGLTSFDQQFTALRLHLSMAHPELSANLDNPVAGAQPSAKAEKLPRPTLDVEITEVEWTFFMSEWTRYKRSTGLTGQFVTDQLWACASDSLRRSCHQSGATETTTEEQLLELMKKLSIKAQNRLVNIVQFLSMTQGTEEPVTQYISRLKGQSKVCDFSITCSKAGCDTAVSYADKMVGHQLVRGLSDISTQERVLALAATEENLTLKKMTEYVEAQESGIRSSRLLEAEANVSKISDYKRSGMKNNNETSTKESTQETKGKQNLTEVCYYCSKTGHGSRPDIETRKSECEAWGLQCNNCGKVGHIKSACRSTDAQTKAVRNQYEDEEDDSALVFSMSTLPRRQKYKRGGRQTLPHIAVNEFGEWTPSEPDSHPVVVVTVSVSSDSYAEHNIPEPAKHQPTNVQAIADTAAQVLVGGMNLVHQLGVKKHELVPISQKVRAGNRSPLQLIGGMLLNLRYEHETGEVREYRQLCYIAHDVDTLLLSKTTLQNLGIIPRDFPRKSNIKHRENEDKPPAPPSYPFEQIHADFFSYGRHKYLVIVDKYSLWVSVQQVSAGAGAEVLKRLLRQHFSSHGASQSLTTSGGPEFLSPLTNSYLRGIGVTVLPSAFLDHMSQEQQAVEAIKRLIRNNTARSGLLDSVSFSRAMKEFRNQNRKVDFQCLHN